MITNKKLLLFLLVVIASFIGAITLIISNGQRETLQTVEQNGSEINITVFSELPKSPNNFILLRRNFYDSQIKDLSRINESYWKRPEWYPTWESNGRKWFTEHDYSRWGVHGFGIFPSVVSYSISNMSAGKNMDIHTFLHTSWGIETWQGIRIVPQYNTTLFYVKPYPEDILLEPTYPNFYYNWTQIIRLNVTAKQNIPPGEYSFSVSVSSPDDKTNENWAWDVLDKYTNNLYSEEIQKCKKQTQLSEKCTNLLELRQGRYVVGGTFVPSNIFTATVSVTN